tara:strand:- start:2139 stop:4268 length:2130 start_codon:yes stop_codon:yes gene_type:complete
VRIVGWCVLAVGVACLGLYGALPWLAPGVVGWLVRDYPVSVIELQVQRPEWRSWSVDRVMLSGSGLSLDARDVEIDYEWSDLLAGRVDQVRVTSVRVLDAGDGLQGDEGPAELRADALLLSLPAQVEALWAELPARTLQIADLQAESAGQRARGSLHLTHEQMRLQAQSGAFELAVDVARGGVVRLEVRQGENVALVESSQWLAQGALVIDWTLDDMLRASGQAAFQIGSDSWRVGPGLRLQSGVPGLAARVLLSAVTGSWATDQHADVQASFGWTIDRLPWGDFRGQGSASASLQGDRALVSVHRGSRLEAQGAVAFSDEIAMDGLHAQVVEDLQLRGGLLDLKGILESGLVKVCLNGSAWGDYTTSPVIMVELAGGWLDAAGIAANLRLDSAELQLAGDAAVSVLFESGDWRADLSARQKLAGGLLARALTSPAPAFDVDGGDVSLELSARGVESLSYDAQGHLALQGLQAHYGDVTVDDISAELVFDLHADGWDVRSQLLSVRKLDVGFPVTSVSAGFSGRQDLLRLSEVRAQLLGGTLHIDAMGYPLDGAPVEFLVRASGVELAAVLALEGDEVTGEGVLDGELPVRLENGEVSVEGGRFSARPAGGVLRYAEAEQVAASLDQAGVGFAVSALADYRFDVLDVGVNYAADGDLLLAVRLEGRNPSIEGGRPIHYNLNVTENVPALLKSLQLSDEVELRVERRLGE